MKAIRVRVTIDMEGPAASRPAPTLNYAGSIDEPPETSRRVNVGEPR